jgi:hypothetical protein
MNQVASAHGPGLLFGMLQMSHLAPNAAAEDDMMLHAVTAAAEQGSQPDMAAAAAGCLPDSPTDALPDFEAAQLHHSHSGLTGSAPVDVLQLTKKECKPLKGTFLAGWAVFECADTATAPCMSKVPQRAPKHSSYASYASKIHACCIVGAAGASKKSKTGHGRRQVLVCKVRSLDRPATACVCSCWHCPHRTQHTYTHSTHLHG